jgi:hypothetical protein
MSRSEPPPEPTSTEPEIGTKSVPQGHHPNSRKNLAGGPGRPPGSRDRFSKEAIANFVNQYRNDLAADWDKHGEQFIAKCREMFPQIYATMQRMRIEDELTRVQADAGPITITWAATPTPPPTAPEPPQQLTYKPPSAPADLTPADWSILMSVLELLKRTVPSNDDRPPAEIFDVLRKALLEHFREKDQ